MNLLVSTAALKWYEITLIIFSAFLILILVFPFIILSQIMLSFALKKKELPPEDKLSWPHTPDGKISFVLDNEWIDESNDQKIEIASYDKLKLVGHFIKEYPNSHRYLL